MRILLIRPSQEAFFHTVERHYPIGLLYIAKALISAGNQVTVLDCLTHNNKPFPVDDECLLPTQREKLKQSEIFSKVMHYGCNWSDVEEVIEKVNPEIIGITIMFSCFYDVAYDWCHKIKKRFPQIAIVAGGAHISAYYQHALDQKCIDYCLRYEGEKTFPELVKCIYSNIRPYHVEGIAFRDEKRANQVLASGVRVYSNNKKHWITELDSLFPELDIINADDYAGTVTLITSRGCPYNCKFCLVSSTMGNSFRKRTPSSILAEIEEYNKRGIHSFNIEDDNFSLDMNRVVTLFTLICEKQLDANFYLLNGIIAQNIDDDILSLFSKAGVKKLFFGLESTSEQVRRNLNKTHSDLENIKCAVHSANRFGIEAGVSLIIGFPTQTFDDILQDIATLFIQRIPPLAINALYPLPDTPMYNECVSLGILTGFEDYTLLGGDNFPIKNNSFSRDDLYHIWVSVRAITKWSWSKGYWNFNKLSIHECMTRICKQIHGSIIQESDSNILVKFNKDVLASEILSYQHKVWTDMITSYCYLHTGRYILIEVFEEGEFIKLTGTKNRILHPNQALFRLRNALIEAEKRGV